MSLYILLCLDVDVLPIHCISDYCTVMVFLAKKVPHPRRWEAMRRVILAVLPHIFFLNFGKSLKLSLL